jgi:glycosyltransferase involved in cell wall biosynthesis
MDVSVVVPAFNEEAGLDATLRSIGAAMQAFDAAGWTSELIVCDNNSTDRTATIARAAGATVVFEPYNQIGRARNAGAAAATGRWLVFVDADSHPTAALFTDVAAAMRDPRCLAGGSTVTFASRHPLVRVAGWYWNTLSRVMRWAAGSFIFVEAAAFRAVGGFDTRLYAAEEIDLFRRLKRLARGTGRTIVILHRHPLMTSDRRVHLYSGREMLAFASRTLLKGPWAFRSRAGASPWYDGRR